MHKIGENVVYGSVGVMTAVSFGGCVHRRAVHHDDRQGRRRGFGGAGVYNIVGGNPMQRYSTTQFVLIRQPRPADRESRFRPAKDRSAHRPRKEAAHV